MKELNRKATNVVNGGECICIPIGHTSWVTGTYVTTRKQRLISCEKTCCDQYSNAIAWQHYTRSQGVLSQGNCVDNMNTYGWTGRRPYLG